MKRLSGVFSILLISVSVFASPSVFYGGGIRNSSQRDNPSFFLLGFEYNDYSLLIHKSGLDMTSVQLGKRGHFSDTFGWRADAVLNAFDSDTYSFLLDGIFDVRIGKEHFFFDAGAGVQLGSVKYPSLDKLLFTLSPLISLDFDFLFCGNRLTLFCSFYMPYERQLKAVPTLGVAFARDLGERIGLSVTGWMRGAEYLMDPWLVIQSYGVSLSMTVKGGK